MAGSVARGPTIDITAHHQDDLGTLHQRVRTLRGRDFRRILETRFGVACSLHGVHGVWVVDGAGWRKAEGLAVPRVGNG